MKRISYNPLWKKLVDVGWNKTELAEKTGIARSTIAKMGKDEFVSLEVIVKICNVLNCEIYDVIELKEAQRGEQ